jgi:hypothetical protein
MRLLRSTNQERAIQVPFGEEAMKNILSSAAAFGVVALVAISQPVLAQSSDSTSGGNSESTSPSPLTCQNLTPENRDSCCAAENWKDVISKEDYAFCPPMGDENDSLRLGRNFDGEGETTGSISNDNANGDANQNNSGTNN